MYLKVEVYEVKNMEKEWYKSKTVWAGLIIAVYGIFNGYLEPYKEVIISLATGLGIVGIRAALK